MMKNLISFLAVLSFVLPTISAQTALSTAVDFTLEDRFGQQHSLFEILEGDKYVLIDFFAHWCEPCCDIAPDINKLYRNFGCNEGAVHIMSIEGAGTASQLENFENICGGPTEKPVVTGMEGGGSGVSSEYNLGFYPTIILIAPNGEIVEADIWPFSYDVAAEILQSYGIELANCLTNHVSNAVITDIDLTPNPVYNSASIEFNISEAGICNMELINLAGQTVKVILNENRKAGYNKIDFNVLGIANGAYFVKIQTENALPQVSKLVISK